MREPREPTYHDVILFVSLDGLRGHVTDLREGDLLRARLGRNPQLLRPNLPQAWRVSRQAAGIVVHASVC